MTYTESGRTNFLIPPKTKLSKEIFMDSNLLYANAIRATAVLTMILFHSTGAYYYDKSNHAWWVIADIVRSGTSVCVPLFFMLSGMLLLDHHKANEPIHIFLHKRLKKIIVPLSFWSVIYLIFGFYKTDNYLNIYEIIIKILSGPVFYHLWFMYALLGLYLATPVLRLITQKAGNDIYLYFLFLWILIISLVPIMKDFLGIKIDLRIVVTTGYSGYFIAGYYLKNKFLPANKIIYVLMTYIIFLSFTAYCNYYFSFIGQQKFSNYFLKFTGFNVIAMSFCIFMIIKSLYIGSMGEKNTSLVRVIEYLSTSSFGIYLVHALFLETLRSGHLGFKIHKLGGITNHPFVGITLTFFLTLLLSTFTTHYLRKLKYLKFIVP